MTLSVIVIARDEERVIRRCLQSVAWADEIVMLDSGSSDRTAAIGREQGARVIVTPEWPGFGAQKNRAIEQAKGDWVLSLDADEWVSEALCGEIRDRIAGPTPCAAFAMPRRSSFCGRWMRHSGWWPDYVTRLFRRDRARFSEEPVHERLLVDGSVERLGNPLLHESFLDLEEVLDKLNRYSTLNAQSLAGRGRRAGLAAAVGHAAWTFLKTYVLRLGFLDGREGFMLAVSNAEGTYYKYLKLMLRHRRTGSQGGE